MFIVNLEYKKDLKEVEKYLEEHRAYLDKNYANGNFIASGRKNPRTGGIILVKGNIEKDIWDIVKEDPFYREEIVEISIIEFEASKTCEALKGL